MNVQFAYLNVLSCMFNPHGVSHSPSRTVQGIQSPSRDVTVPHKTHPEAWHTSTVKPRARVAEHITLPQYTQCSRNVNIITSASGSLSAQSASSDIRGVIKDVDGNFQASTQVFSCDVQHLGAINGV